MKTATEISRSQSQSGANWRHYQVSPPVVDEDGNSHDYVIVSAVVAMFSGPETYIFPADESGKVVDWGELDGSYRGGLDHTAALAGAGYTVQEAVPS